MVIVVMMTMMLMIMTTMTMTMMTTMLMILIMSKVTIIKMVTIAVIFFFPRPRAEKNGFSHMQVNLSWNYCTKFYDDFFRLRIAI